MQYFTFYLCFKLPSLILLWVIVFFFFFFRSTVYKWQQGSLIPFQQIDTQGATGVDAFSISASNYLVIANSQQNGRLCCMMGWYSRGGGFVVRVQHNDDACIKQQCFQFLVYSK